MRSAGGRRPACHRPRGRDPRTGQGWGHPGWGHPGLWRLPGALHLAGPGGPRRTRRPARRAHPAAVPALDRCPVPARPAGRVLPVRGQPGRRRRQPVRPRLRPPHGRAGAGAAVLSGLPRRDEPRAGRGRCVRLPVRLGTHVGRLLGAGPGAPPRAAHTARRRAVSADGDPVGPRPAARLRPARRAGRGLQLRRHARSRTRQAGWPRSR